MKAGGVTDWKNTRVQQPDTSNTRLWGLSLVTELGIIGVGVKWVLGCSGTKFRETKAVTLK